MTCILELNDAQLTLHHDREVIFRSPGIAVILDREVLFGEDALRLARIHPRQANQQYFTRLNADPLPVPGPRARNHADLVYLHLQTLKPLIDAEGGEVLLAVPGILSADQLGVLLGILQRVDIHVCGFVDAAVAALATADAPPDLWHVDVMMQRAVLTRIGADGEVRKVAVQEVPECGLNRLLDGWINVIADRFVHETRFDPLHAAATEQQVFNQVYDWVQQREPPADLAVEVVHGEHTRRVEIGRRALEDKAAQRFRQLADAMPAGAAAFVSARSARLPGLRTALAGRRLAVTALAADALAEGCLANLQRIVPEDGELRLVTRLPHAGRSAAAPVAAPAAAPGGTAPAPLPHVDTGARPAPGAPAAGSEPATAEPLPPTHALHGSAAMALDAPTLGLPLRREGRHYLLRPEDGVLLNGAPPSRATVLETGDRLALGEREYLIIHVAD